MLQQESSMLKRQLETADETVSSKVAKTQEAMYICLYIVKSGDFVTKLIQSSIKVIHLSTLFSHDTHQDIDSISQCVFKTSNPYTLHTGTGMVATTDGSLYVATSEYPPEPETEIHSPCQMLKYCLGANHQLQRVDLNKTNSSWSCKAFPILVQIKQCLYVLHRPLYNYDFFMVDKPFEMYDLTNHVWKTLDPPPFLGKGRMLLGFASKIIKSCIVPGQFLYVSTEEMSCAFDTESQKWGRCDLFSPYFDGNPDIDWFSGILYECYMRNRKRSSLYAAPKPENDVGVPFSTINGLEYGDYLLWVMMPFDRDVVALKVVDGKLGKPEVLLKQFTPAGTYYTDCYLVGLGGGEFCQITHYKVSLGFTKFKVLKSPCGGLYILCRS